MKLSGIVLGAPDPKKLALFYQELLGWELGADEPEWVTLKAPEGPKLSFQLETEHVPPVWPAKRGDQQMQIHLDILVENLEEAGARAIAAGAALAEVQPQEGVRVYLDPAGHPFCLFLPGF